jgi:glycerol 3-phosphatase-2
LADVAGLPSGRRPTFVGPDLSALVVAHPEVTVDEASASCESATAMADGDSVRLTRGEPGSLDAVRAVIALAWASGDRSGRDVRVDGTLGP